MSPKKRGGTSKRKKKPPKRKKHRAHLNQKRVTLTNCVADPDPAPLRPHGDEVLWESRDVGYDLDFVDSPFVRGGHFRVDPPRTTPSGPVKRGAYGDYKYSVKGDNGCSIDPKIRIGP